MPKSFRRLELSQLILTSKSDINRRVNEETEVYPLLDIKKTIYLTGISFLDPVSVNPFLVKDEVKK